MLLYAIVVTGKREGDGWTLAVGTKAAGEKHGSTLRVDGRSVVVSMSSETDESTKTTTLRHRAVGDRFLCTGCREVERLSSGTQPQK